MKLTGILLILILGAGGYIYYMKSQPPHWDKALGSTVIAFDYDGRHKKVTTQSMLRGDALIFLKVSPDDTVDFIETLDQLQIHDSKKKGYIALDSPDFIHFYFGRYLKKKKIIEFRKLHDSGIGGIALKYSEEKVQSAQVILFDNSRRTLNEVPVNADIFKNIKLKECDEHCDLPRV